MIFSDEELTKIEDHYGMEFVQAYEKIWNERKGVKNYFSVVNRNHSSTTGWTKKYWEYKIQECRGVLENQTAWLQTIAMSMKEVVSEEMYAKLQAYLIENDPLRNS